MSKAVSKKSVEKKEPVFKVPHIFFKHKAKPDDVYFGGHRPKIVEYESTITLFEDFENEKDKNNKEIGHIMAYKVSDLRDFSHREIVKACKFKRQNLRDAFKAAFKNTPEGTRPKPHRDINVSMKRNFFYIDTVLIFNEHRGLGIGKIAVKRLVEDLAGDCVLLVKPYAFENHKSIKAHKKVRKFWRELGFKEMSRTGFYIASQSKVIKS